jgi:hypothetical protein
MYRFNSITYRVIAIITRWHKYHLTRRLRKREKQANKIATRVRLLWQYGHGAAAQALSRELEVLQLECLRLRDRLGLRTVVGSYGIGVAKPVFVLLLPEGKD